jgi:hypothetical protein
MLAWLWSWFPDSPTQAPAQVQGLATVPAAEPVIPLTERPRSAFAVSAEQLQEYRRNLKPTFDPDLVNSRTSLPRPVWIAATKDEELLRTLMARRREVLEGF